MSNKKTPRGKMVERTCKCCGDLFVARNADVKRGWAKFCSKACKAIRQESRTGQYKRYQYESEYGGNAEFNYKGEYIGFTYSGPADMEE